MGRKGQLDADDQHIVSIVDWLLQYAFDRRASDVHIEPRREQCSGRFRIDSVLHYVYGIPASLMAAVATRIKTLGRMDAAAKRRTQDGRVKTGTPDGREIELGLSTLHTNDPPSALTRLVELGTPPYPIGATLLGVMAQRLARTLRAHCREAMEPDPVLWRELVSRSPRACPGGSIGRSRAWNAATRAIWAVPVSTSCCG